MSLKFRGEVNLPAHQAQGGFDHGDVDVRSGQVFIAHLVNGTVDVIDGSRLQYLATVESCAEASGVLSCPDDGLVVAAARGTGFVVVIDPVTYVVRHRVFVGGRPNGLAWDSRRRQLLVADVEGNLTAIIKPSTGKVLATGTLPGRSAWAGYDPISDQYLLNIRSVDVVALIDPESGHPTNAWPVSSSGPHGMAIDHTARRLYVACDDGSLISLDLDSGREDGSVNIAGAPDAIWFNPVAGEVYVAIGNPGVVQVVSADGLTVTETVETGPGSHTLAFDDLRQELYVFRPSTCSALAYTIHEP